MKLHQNIMNFAQNSVTIDNGNLQLNLWTEKRFSSGQNVTTK